MMMSRRYPFTACQWQELEHQALVFKYMVSGIPIPPDLIFTLQTTLPSSIPNPCWNLVSSGSSSNSSRKIDPEPGRCRRTDGKKWRCSKDAHHDSKYCDRHMHRGRNRSRKPLDFDININTAINTQPPPTPPTQFLYTYNHSPTTGIDDVASSHLTMGNDSLQAQPNKVAVTTHRFLEEWAQPKHRSSDSDETRLSMTPATANPLHDFFVTHKW